MRRALFSAGLGVTALGALAISGTARAWDSPEHDGFGQAAVGIACASGVDTNKIVCNTDDQQSYVTLAGTALAEPDHCHSFWYSDTGIGLNATDSDSREQCGINFGTPTVGVGSQLVAAASPLVSAGYKYLDHTIYVLVTNSNHFGANTKGHFNLYHQIALQAAKTRSQLASLYTKAPDTGLTTPNPLLKTCTQDAVAIEGFSLHYVTDRAAAGHAWNAEPRYTSSAFLPASMAGLRGCIHGQDFLTKQKLNAGTNFACVDSFLLPTGPKIHQGLGDIGRTFGGAFFTDLPWYSDDQYLQTPDNGAAPSTGKSKQQSQVSNPASAAFEEVLSALNGSSGTDPTWTDTFVSNQDFCKVALSECCRNPSTGSVGTCDSCTPDITDASVKQYCPVDSVQTSAVSGAQWVTLAGGLLQSTLYYAHLNMSTSTASSTTAAETVGHTTNTSTLNPDALWDQKNDIVTRLGCTKFDVTSVSAPDAPLSGAAVTATIKFEGNPQFPVTVHWRSNKDTTYGPVCKDAAGVTGLCNPEDYTISAAANGTTYNTPKPLSVTNWVCPGTGTSSTPVSAPGYLYLTDATGAWTPAFPATLKCGAGDAGLTAFDAGVQKSVDGSTDGPLDSTVGTADAPDSSFSLDADSGQGTCTHDVCTAGAALGSTCNSCAQKICSMSASNYCCTDMWGASCVLQANQYCGSNCPQ